MILVNAGKSICTATHSSSTAPGRQLRQPDRVKPSNADALCRTSDLHPACFTGPAPRSPRDVHVHADISPSDNNAVNRNGTRVRPIGVPVLAPIYPFFSMRI
jgi:hypothetical protein